MPQMPEFNRALNASIKPFLNPTKSEMREILTTQFSPKNPSSLPFEKFFIRYWSKDYFLRVTSLVSLYTGTLPVEGREFVIIYHRTTRGKILEMKGSDQLALSFRAASKDYGLPAYVLVSSPLAPQYITAA